MQNVDSWTPFIMVTYLIYGFLPSFSLSQIQQKDSVNKVSLYNITYVLRKIVERSKEEKLSSKDQNITNIVTFFDVIFTANAKHTKYQGQNNRCFSYKTYSLLWFMTCFDVLGLDCKLNFLCSYKVTSSKNIYTKIMIRNNASH